MEERDFFSEKDELKPANLSCPFCRQAASYDVRWRRRTKKASLPGHATQEDRMKFAKARSYLVRVDDQAFRDYQPADRGVSLDCAALECFRPDIEQTGCCDGPASPTSFQPRANQWI